MRLARLRAVSFRNLKDLDFAPEARIAVLFGANAQGKTNLVEALYVLSNLQSFRTHRVRDLVTFGDRGASVEGAVESRGVRTRLRVSLRDGTRQATVDEKAPPSTGTYLSEFHTVLFSPLDLDLARGNQELRRRFVDRATFLEDPQHLARLRALRRVLRQRNALLSSGAPGLDVWDERYAELATAVYAARRGTLERLSNQIAAMHRHIAGGLEAVELQLSGPGGDPPEVKALLLEKLAAQRERDVRLGYTGSGPHRQALRVRLGGDPLERHASQGQMRTLALSLKLALLRWSRDVLGHAPVFLLDDPGSELDRDRLEFLGAFLSQWQGQVVIAATERHAVPLDPAAQAQPYRVVAGTVNPA